IPGAINVPWNVFFDEVTEELIPPNRLNLKIEKTDTVVYCRTGARASLVWFYLKYLLGFPRVRLYDGSWAEWGNMVGVPVER
ncbi:MAG: rhodanese-like domain-containing protein, partial [Metallosphaera sp.]